MSAPPELIRVVRLWVEKAEEDLTNAEHTLKLREGCPLATVCFHAQQCVEKRKRRQFWPGRYVR